MIQPARVLRPLEEAEDAIRGLAEYRTADELADALARVAAAVDASLRRLLRSDPDTPDALRLEAMSAEAVPLRRVLEALRRQSRISLETATGCVELEHAAARAARGQPHAVDADLAERVVARLRRDVARAAAEAKADAARGAPKAAERKVEEPEPRPPRPRSRSLAVTAAVIAGLVLVAFLFSLLRSFSEELDAAVASFRAGRLAEARERFAEVVADAPENVTARLYLARIHRRGEAYEEAAEQLREAVALAPDDADVRRELGYLFGDLGRPAAAAEQFRRAVELEPASEASWIGLITSLREAGDPEATQWLMRAPPTVRALLAESP